MSNVGFRIYKDFERVSQKIIDGFKGIPTPNIGDVLGRNWAMDYTVKLMNKKSISVVGSALTVRTTPTDNLMVHKAMDLAKPGDVIVIDAFDGNGNAIFGDLMCTYAQARGIAGFVTDGPMRDVDDITALEFPVFAKGTTPRGPYKEGPGEINTVISCGNVPVQPGDIIVGDSDGVVVIPKEEAETVLEKVVKVVEFENKVIKSIQETGRWERPWMDEVLERKGCEIHEFWGKK